MRGHRPNGDSCLCRYLPARDPVTRAEADGVPSGAHRCREATKADRVGKAKIVPHFDMGGLGRSPQRRAGWARNAGRPHAVGSSPRGGRAGVAPPCGPVLRGPVEPGGSGLEDLSGDSGWRRAQCAPRTPGPRRRGPIAARVPRPGHESVV